MKSIVYADGEWHSGDARLTGPMHHAFWKASAVFDGGRSLGGLAPDLDLHCARAVASARAIRLKPPLTGAEVHEVCVEAIARFPRDAELYVRPMFYAAEGSVVPDPDSTRFTLAVYEAPLPTQGFSACLSSKRRPARDMAPTDAKAICLYPNSYLAIMEAQDRGFDNAVVLDSNGNVAEFANANLWIGQDGVAVTPAANGTFLNGITRQRVIALLRADGIAVIEKAITFADVVAADEVFNSGNFGKLTPVARLEGRELQPGPIYQRARELYFDYAKGFNVV